MSKAFFKYSSNEEMRLNSKVEEVASLCDSVREAKLEYANLLNKRHNLGIFFITAKCADRIIEEYGIK